MEYQEYQIWETKFDILVGLVAIFFDLEKAKEFVYERATVGESYIIKQNGKEINID
jgi:hypothetical protein